jgi:hypothetical protein
VRHVSEGHAARYNHHYHHQHHHLNNKKKVKIRKKKSTDKERVVPRDNMIFVIWAEQDVKAPHLVPPLRSEKEQLPELPAAYLSNTDAAAVVC